MTKKQLSKILTQLNILKENNGLEIVDSHVHPLDVMGVVHHSETKFICPDHDMIAYRKPGLMERLNYGVLEKLGSKLYFKLNSAGVKKMIKKTYSEVNDMRIINEMKIALVDQSVLLALDPWVPTNLVGDQYSSDRKFCILGSLDIHNIESGMIDGLIRTYIEKYNIIGIKMHPNLQNFKPEPSRNGEVIAERLRKLYSVIRKNNLYLLLHGGISNFTRDINLKYGAIHRSKDNGLLENFFDVFGRSELFSSGFPIIIAHLGHYGTVNVNYKLLHKICSDYSNIFFDTSGVSAAVIQKSLALLPSDRVIFGSDALYNRTAYNIAFLYEAVMNSNNKADKISMLHNIFYRNIRGLITKKL